MKFKKIKHIAERKITKLKGNVWICNDEECTDEECASALTQIFTRHKKNVGKIVKKVYDKAEKIEKKLKKHIKKKLDQIPVDNYVNDCSEHIDTYVERNINNFETKCEYSKAKSCNRLMDNSKQQIKKEKNNFKKSIKNMLMTNIDKMFNDKFSQIYVLLHTLFILFIAYICCIKIDKNIYTSFNKMYIKCKNHYPNYYVEYNVSSLKKDFNIYILTYFVVHALYVQMIDWISHFKISYCQ